MQGTELHTDPKKGKRMTAKIIKRCRRRKGMTQKTLAKKLGINVTSVSKYENGHRRMSVRLSAKAIRVLQPKETDR